MSESNQDPSSQDPWSAPTGSGGAGEAPPPVTDLASRTASKVMEDFVPFLVAGLPFLGLVFVSIFAALILIYGSMFAGFIVGATVLGDEQLGAVLSGVGALVGTLVFLLGVTLVAAPMAASLMRAVWQLLETGEKLTIGSSFSTIGQDVVKIVMFNFVLMAAVLFGSLFCYVPGLAIAAALAFATPAIVIHRLPIGPAMRLSVSHMQQHPGWHLGFFALSMILAMILGYIPIIGYALLATIHPLFVLMAYREVFGNGPLPRGYAG